MFSEGASTPARRRSLSDIESPVLRAAAAAARPLTPRGAPGGAHVFESGENVRVLVRVRPESAREAACTAAGAPPAVAVVGRDDAGGEEVLSRIMVATDGVQHEFSFDRVFGPGVEQAELYDATVRPMVDGVLNGVNGAVLAYGQTSSGKTHTIQGSPEDPGIVPRLFDDLFARAELLRGCAFDVRLSFVEIYNEAMYDLITGGESAGEMYGAEGAELLIRGVSETRVGSTEAAMDVYNRGVRNRTIAETAMNHVSSRSHAILLVTVARIELSEPVLRVAQLYLCDLAGSERVWKTDVSGTQLQEAKYINRSLLALGKVIAALAGDGGARGGRGARGARAQHVPYRDSKLTRLLQNSLGGNARTCLVACVSPSSYNAAESLSTARFAAAAARIVNAPVANEEPRPAALRALIAAAQADADTAAARERVLTGEMNELLAFFSAAGFTDPDVASLHGQAADAADRARLGHGRRPRQLAGASRDKRAAVGAAPARVLSTPVLAAATPTPSAAEGGLGAAAAAAVSAPHVPVPVEAPAPAPITTPPAGAASAVPRVTAPIAAVGASRVGLEAGVSCGGCVGSAVAASGGGGGGGESPSGGGGGGGGARGGVLARGHVPLGRVLAPLGATPLGAATPAAAPLGAATPAGDAPWAVAARAVGGGASERAMARKRSNSDVTGRRAAAASAAGMAGFVLRGAAALTDAPE